MDNTIGASEVLLWSDALTNAADSVNWTLVFANTTFGPFSDRPPAVFRNYDNADHNNATNDFAVTFGKAVSDDLVPQSDLMAANGWNTALKMTVNKALGAEAGVNLYPQGINLRGNYALRFDMYLSLYQYASNNPGIGPPAREFAAFGINHRGTNCNWRLDVNPRPLGTGSGPTNWDGAWIAVDASSGSITPADYEVYRSPGLTNNAGGGAPGAGLISVTATFVAGIFKHPPFSAINPTGGGEPANQWVAVSLETTAQTNVTLLINGQKIFAGSGAFALTNSPITATYSNGAPMLGYLDPNKSISDSSAFVYYSNVRAVELSPYILAQPNVVTNGVVTNAFNTGVFGVPTNVIHIITPGFSSLTFTSSATLGTAPITNRWFRGTGTIGSGIGTPSHTNALQTNVVAGTSMNDRFTNTFNSLADGTNYMCLYSDAAGSITSTIVSVEVVFGPTSQTNNLGATTNLLVTAAGPSAPTAFQWYFNAASNAGPVSTWTKLANSAHLAGVTTASLFITNTLATDAGFYWCATTNAAGGIILEAAQMSVISPPSVAGVTPPNLVKFWGSTATFTVTNNGTAPFTYQWKRSGTNMVNGAVSGAANISGAMTSALTLTGVTRNDAGNYSAAVDNPAGSIVSGIGTLSVLVPPSTVSSVSVSGGNATLAFTSPNPNDTSAAFILQSAGIVTGPYTNNAGGVFSGPVGGPFQVVVPTGAGDTLFYRLLHVQ